MLFSVSGCSFLDDIASLYSSGFSVLNDITSLVTQKEKHFTIDNYNLQITADNTFHEDTNGDFDLQITNNDCYISIMAYTYVDLPQDITPQDIYDLQNEDLLSKRENVKLIEDLITRTDPEKTIS